MKELIAALTHLLPRFINKRLQYWGERRRSRIASQEPETNLPFPYNDATYMEAYCLNRKFAEPDFEAYWESQQLIIDRQVALKNIPGPQLPIGEP